MSNISNQASPLLGKLILILASLWLGNLLTIGYMAAPTLFMTLHDRALAGTIAGSLFAVQFWCSIGFGALLLILVQRSASLERKLATGLIILMLLSTCLSHLLLQPEMAALRAQAGGILQGAAQSRFGLLHGVSSSLYLLQTLAGAVLLWRLAR
jgi:hypothetical protein